MKDGSKCGGRKFGLKRRRKRGRMRRKKRGGEEKAEGGARGEEAARVEDKAEGDFH